MAEPKKRLGKIQCTVYTVYRTVTVYPSNMFSRTPPNAPTFRSCLGWLHSSCLRPFARTVSNWGVESGSGNINQVYLQCRLGHMGPDNSGQVRVVESGVCTVRTQTNGSGHCQRILVGSE